MKKRSYKHYIEIMPAAYLLKHRRWQIAANSLPIGACLLVINQNNKAQTKLMQTIAHAFREKGKRVDVWTIG